MTSRVAIGRAVVTTASLMAGLSLPAAARAQPPENAQTEITFLLATVKASGCEFSRNGTWYDSMKAQAHLRKKYDYLVARNRIHTAEDFIQQVATKSSITGRPYVARCAGNHAVAADQWLRDRLTHFRASMPQTSLKSDQ